MNIKTYHRVPAEDLPERVGIRRDDVGDAGAVVAKSVGGKVVDEPDDHDSKKTGSVHSNDKAPRSLGVPHCLTLDCFGLLQLPSGIDQSQGRNATETDDDSPGCSFVICASDKDNNHGAQSSDGVAHVNGEVGEPDKPAVASALFELTSALGTGDGSSRVLASDSDTSEEAICSKSREQSRCRAAGAISTSGQRIEHEENDLGRLEDCTAEHSYEGCAYC